MRRGGRHRHHAGGRPPDAAAAPSSSFLAALEEQRARHAAAAAATPAAPEPAVVAPVPVAPRGYRYDATKKRLYKVEAGCGDAKPSTGPAAFGLPIAPTAPPSVVQYLRARVRGVGIASAPRWRQSAAAASAPLDAGMCPPTLRSPALAGSIAYGGGATCPISGALLLAGLDSTVRALQVDAYWRGVSCVASIRVPAADSGLTSISADRSPAGGGCVAVTSLGSAMRAGAVHILTGAASASAAGAASAAVGSASESESDDSVAASTADSSDDLPLASRSHAARDNALPRLAVAAAWSPSTTMGSSWCCAWLAPGRLVTGWSAGVPVSMLHVRDSGTVEAVAAVMSQTDVLCVSPSHAGPDVCYMGKRNGDLTLWDCRIRPPGTGAATTSSAAASRGGSAAARAPVRGRRGRVPPSIDGAATVSPFTASAAGTCVSAYSDSDSSATTGSQQHPTRRLRRYDLASVVQVSLLAAPYVVAASATDALHVYDSRWDREPVQSLVGYSNAHGRYNVAVSAGSDIVAAACTDGVVRLWDARRSALVACHAAHDNSLHAAGGGSGTAAAASRATVEAIVPWERPCTSRLTCTGVADALDGGSCVVPASRSLAFAVIRDRCRVTLL